MSDPMKTLFEGVDGLSPEFMDKAKNLVEAQAKVQAAQAITEAENVLREAHEKEMSQLREAHEQELANVESNLMENFAPVLNTFLENAVMKWAEDNAVAIDSKLKVECATQFLTGLGGLFTEANVEVPEATSIVEGLEAQVEQLTEELNKKTEALLESENKHKLDERNKLVENAVKDMTDTQADRVRSLTEGDDYSNLEAFGARVSAYCQLVEAQDKDGDDDTDGEPEDDNKDKKPVTEGDDPEASQGQINEGVDPIVAATLAAL